MAEKLDIAFCVDNLSKFANNAEFANLAGKRILILSSRKSATIDAEKLDVAKEVVFAMDKPGDVAAHLSTRGLSGLMSGNSVDEGHFDRIFFDVRDFPPGAVGVGDWGLMNDIRRLLSKNGVAFSIWQCGKASRLFDQQNSYAYGASRWLPDRALLFDLILQDWAVRTMRTGPGEANSELLLLRLSPLRPTILLVCGKSMSGKTTLARQLADLKPGMHVSNDFIYVQLVGARDRGELKESPLVDSLGDGSGQACGNFNRALESDSDLLNEYLHHLVQSIPPAMNLVSIDFDLREDTTVRTVKDYLAARGYSVWVMRR